MNVIEPMSSLELRNWMAHFNYVINILPFSTVNYFSPFRIDVRQIFGGRIALIQWLSVILFISMKVFFRRTPCRGRPNNRTPKPFSIRSWNLESWPALVLQSEVESRTNELNCYTIFNLIQFAWLRNNGFRFIPSIPNYTNTNNVEIVFVCAFVACHWHHHLGRGTTN